MKKLTLREKIIVIGACVLFLSSTTYAQLSQVTPASFFRRSGSALLTVPAGLTLGSPATPISAGYFTNLFASTTSFTHAGGDLDMGGFAITNAGVITGTRLVATSTTATSTITADLEAANLEVTGTGGALYGPDNFAIWDKSQSPILFRFTFSSGNQYNARSGGSHSFLVNGTQVGVLNTTGLGIGTSSPYAKLAVVGEVVARNFTATSTTATSTFAGAVGIGTTSPTNALHVVGVSAFKIERSGVGSVVFNNSNAMSGSTGGDLVIDPQQASTGFLFRPRNGSNTAVNGLGIDLNGNVAVGTTTPVSKLDVYGGTISVTGASITHDVLRLGTSAAGLGVAFEALNSSRTNYSPLTLYGTSLTYINGSQTRTDMAITTTGLVGFGTTTPAAKLSVTGSSGGTTPIFLISSSTAGFATSTAMVVDSNGNVGIGVGSGAPGAALDLRGDFIINTTGNSRRWTFNTGGTPTNNMYISLDLRSTSDVTNSFLSSTGSNSYLNANGGNVGVGTTTPYAKLSVHVPATQTLTTLFAIGSSTAAATTTHFQVLNSGRIFAQNVASSITGNGVCRTTSGELTDAGAAACIPSSIVYKEDVKLFEESALDIISKLILKTFEYKKGVREEHPNESKQRIGLIAEDVQPVDNRLVAYDKDGNLLTLNFDELSVLQLGAIQELQKEIETLKSQKGNSFVPWIVGFSSAVALALSFGFVASKRKQQDE